MDGPAAGGSIGMSPVALVTGASKGIGRAAAVALAESGYSVACAYRTDDAGAKETVRLVEAAGGVAQAFAADVAEEQKVADLLRAVEAWTELPLVLVACAGVNRDGLAVRYPLADFERTVAVNLTGVFLSVRAALPAMLRARWGRIVAVSSVAGLRGNAGQSAYSASKAGLIGFVRSLAKEYGGRGITANAVCPGFIDTEMTAVLPEGARDRLRAEVPAGRPGKPEEAAAAIRFLASREAAYVNGAVLAVDGGLSA
jgi:3-oxoacyl-[acyl-carrier protein] reductase